MSDRVRVWCLRAASDVLTAREREVATLIGRGMTNREIANALVISIKPADTHADRLRDNSPSARVPKSPSGPSGTDC